jgi:hypothetical protein
VKILPNLLNLVVRRSIVFKSFSFSGDVPKSKGVEVVKCLKNPKRDLEMTDYEECFPVSNHFDCLIDGIIFFCIRELCASANIPKNTRAIVI